MTGNPQDTDMSPSERGVWVVYSDDWSLMRLWRSEVPALRDAVKHGAKVLHCRFGLDPRDVARQQATDTTPGGEA